MLYVRPTFTCPASSGRTTTEVKWDLAFLTSSQFYIKYGIHPKQYIETYGTDNS